MNSDIRLSIGWNRHPKIVKLKRKLGADGVLGIVGLWTFAGEHRPDGILSGMDDDDIAIAADYPGDSSAFVAVLIGLRLVERVGNDLCIHDWKDNNPWASGHKARSDKAKKAIQARWDRRNNIDPDPHGGEKHTTSIEKHTTSIEKQHCSNTPSPSPSPSPKDKDTSTVVDVRPIATATGPTSPPALRAVKPPCPYEAIRDLYHETLPELRQCRSLTETRKGYLRQRWNDWPGPDLDRWRKYFSYIRESDFLMGRKVGSDGRPPFDCDLEWLTRPNNTAKIREGKYHEVRAHG